jgi:uncharacterized protein
MKTRRTLISCDIDFEKDGKQFGFLRLPHSTDDSAYGYIPIPIICIKNGAGPRGFFMAGNHGDEYEGQIALLKLARHLSQSEMKGRIIILPAANLPAVLAGRRNSPVDHKNLNRSFPGDPDGSPTSAIAHYIESVLLPKSDYAIDLHSGGRSLMYMPSALMHRSPDEKRTARALQALKAFGAPIGYIVPEGGDDRKFTSAAERCGIVYLSTELGGGGTVTPESLEVAESGVQRMLEHFGHVQPPPKSNSTPAHSRLMEVGGDDYYVYSADTGLFEPAVDLGANVTEGQIAGTIHFPESPWREPVTLHFRRTGVVLCRRMPSRTNPGDCLFHLGTDYRAQPS